MARYGLTKAKSITVAISAYNEQGLIKGCIESARILTGDIIVVDTQSKDQTVKIAKDSRAQVYTFPYAKYVEPSREFSLKKATGDWVFILDADERMTRELAQEIKKRIFSKENVSHYSVPRKNIFGAKKWLKHGGWWPDYQTRLIKKEAFIAWPKEIHSTPLVKGQQAQLEQPLLHYFHGDFGTMVSKTAIFEDIESALLLKADKAVTTGTFFRKFFGEVYRRLLGHAGFLDGPIGIIEAIYQAFSKTITYLYLYEKKKSRFI